MPAASSARTRRAWAFLAEAAGVEVGRSRPALQSADPPMLRRRLGGASSTPVKPAAAADASESRAESPDATRRDERLRRSARLRGGGGAARIRVCELAEELVRGRPAHVLYRHLWRRRRLLLLRLRRRRHRWLAVAGDRCWMEMRASSASAGERGGKGWVEVVGVGCGEESGGRSRRI